MKLDEQSWINQKLEKEEDEKLKVPTGKYKDINRTIASYLQKFVQYIVEICPKVVEELKKLTSLFEALFDLQKDAYFEVIQNLKSDLLLNYLSLNNELEYNQSFNDEYYWGESEKLLQLIYLDLKSAKNL